MATEQEDRALRIAASNDRYRKNLTDDFGSRCLVVMSTNVAGLPAEQGAKVLKAVADFEYFGPDNDPYGEHDFGAVKVDGIGYFFKFDYFADADHSEGVDPYGDDTIYRKLTIMEAAEY